MSERRRYPRIQDDKIPIKLKLNQFDVVTHTLNISASGVYCKVDKEIPLMSRVRLMLMVPDLSRKDKEEVKTVEVSGVVVRGHPVIVNGQTRHYDVAIFFEELPNKSRQLISQYVSQRMS